MRKKRARKRKGAMRIMPASLPGESDERGTFGSWRLQGILPLETDGLPRNGCTVKDRSRKNKSKKHGNLGDSRQ